VRAWVRPAGSCRPQPTVGGTVDVVCSLEVPQVLYIAWCSAINHSWEVALSATRARTLGSSPAVCHWSTATQRVQICYLTTLPHVLHHRLHCDLQKDDFLYARLVLSPEASQHYSDNDLVLLCKDRPMVRVFQARSQAAWTHLLGATIPCVHPAALTAMPQGSLGFQAQRHTAMHGYCQGWFAPRRPCCNHLVRLHVYDQYALPCLGLPRFVFNTPEILGICFLPMTCVHWHPL
jgi:hypothetical protein